MKQVLENLGRKWGITSITQVVLILCVFACTGSSVLFVSDFFLDLLGFSRDMPEWQRWALKLVVMLPIYQVLLLLWAIPFGQFKFFMGYLKKMFGRMKKNPE